MIVEIQTINTDYMDLLITGLRESGMKELAEIFMLWCFDVEWDPLPRDITFEQTQLLEKILATTCSAWTIKLGNTELNQTKAEIDTIIEDEECADL